MYLGEHIHQCHLLSVVKNCTRQLRMLDSFFIPRNWVKTLHSPVLYKRCGQLSPLSGTEDWTLAVFPYIFVLGPWRPLNFHFITTIRMVVYTINWCIFRTNGTLSLVYYIKYFKSKEVVFKKDMSFHIQQLDTIFALRAFCVGSAQCDFKVCWFWWQNYFLITYWEHFFKFQIWWPSWIFEKITKHWF